MELETSPTPTHNIINTPNPNHHTQNQNEDNLINSDSSEKKQKIPPIIPVTTDWRKIAPKILHAEDAITNALTAKLAADGSVRIQTLSITSFKFVQKNLTDNVVNFHSFPLPEDRVLKVVIRGVPTDVTEEEIKCELELLLSLIHI